MVEEFEFDSLMIRPITPQLSSEFIYYLLLFYFCFVFCKRKITLWKEMFLPMCAWLSLFHISFQAQIHLNHVSQ